MRYAVGRAVVVSPKYFLHYLEFSRGKECISLLIKTDLHNQKIDHPTQNMQDGEIEPGSNCSV